MALSRGCDGPGGEPGPSRCLGSYVLGLPQHKWGCLQETDSQIGLAARSVRSKYRQDSAPPGGSTGNPSLPLPASGGCWHSFAGSSITAISATGAGPHCCLLPCYVSESLNLGPIQILQDDLILSLVSVTLAKTLGPKVIISFRDLMYLSFGKGGFFFLDCHGPHLKNGDNDL